MPPFMSRPPWRTLADMDAHFARSGRRSTARRDRAVRSKAIRGAAVAFALMLAAAFAVSPEIRGLEIATGQSPDRPAPPPASAAAQPCPVPAEFRASFASASREAGVAPELLAAVAYEESRMRPEARSTAGAEGLLQLMPGTARELRVDPRAPHSNVLAGARYLRRMLDRFQGLDLALAAYNAGPSAVEGSGGAVGPGPRAYAERVKARAASSAPCG